MRRFIGAFRRCIWASDEGPEILSSKRLEGGSVGRRRRPLPSPPRGPKDRVHERDYQTLRTGEARIVIEDAAASGAKPRTAAETNPVNDTGGRCPKTESSEESR